MTFGTKIHVFLSLLGIDGPFCFIEPPCNFVSRLTLAKIKRDRTVTMMLADRVLNFSLYLAWLII